MLTKTLNSFLFALRGLRTTWKEENNFKIQVIGAALVLFCVFYFHFSIIESAFSILAITIVLMAEIINTAIEDLCNKIEVNHDPVIGKIKDISSAFVLVAGIGSLVIGCLVFYSHFIYNI